MTTKILIKRSAVQGKIPATTDLDLGEFAINTADGAVFVKKKDPATGDEAIVQVGASSSSATNGKSFFLAN